MRQETGLLAAAGAYLAVTLTPLFVVLIGSRPAPRGFWVELAIALGFIGLAMLGLQAILTARYPRFSATVGQDSLLQFHRQAGLVAYAFVVAHPAILVSARGEYWAFLDPRDELLRALFLLLVLAATTLLVITALWREQLRIPYEWWRLSHGALAVLVVFIGLVHIFRVRYYLESPWKQALWMAIGAASIASVTYARAVKPLRVARRPYRVTGLRQAADRTWLLRVAPEAGPALEFRAGQFAFLTIDDNPFALQQHPFSIASSARCRDHLEFAIKELGDFTAEIGAVRLGERVHLDGPYGSMQLPPDKGAGLVLIAGGIGISPIMSMLRTLRDEGSELPVLLIAGHDRLSGIAYFEELEGLSQELDLEVVHVLSHPPPGWTGEVGVVDVELLTRYLPATALRQRRVVLCGPPPMMEAVEDALLELGIPLSHIESETFDIGASKSVGRRSIQVRRLVLCLATLMLLAAAGFAASAG